MLHYLSISGPATVLMVRSININELYWYIKPPRELYTIMVKYVFGITVVSRHNNLCFPVAVDMFNGLKIRWIFFYNGLLYCYYRQQYYQNKSSKSWPTCNSTGSKIMWSISTIAKIIVHCKRLKREGKKSQLKVSLFH